MVVKLKYSQLTFIKHLQMTTGDMYDKYFINMPEDISNDNCFYDALDQIENYCVDMQDFFLKSGTKINYFIDHKVGEYIKFTLESEYLYNYCFLEIKLTIDSYKAYNLHTHINLFVQDLLEGNAENYDMKGDVYEIFMPDEEVGNKSSNMSDDVIF